MKERERRTDEYHFHSGAVVVYLFPESAHHQPDAGKSSAWRSRCVKRNGKGNVPLVSISLRRSLVILDVPPTPGVSLSVREESGCKREGKEGRGGRSERRKGEKEGRKETYRETNHHHMSIRITQTPQPIEPTPTRISLYPPSSYWELTLLVL